MELHRAQAVWTGEAWLDDAVVCLDAGVVTAVRLPQAGDPPAQHGLLLPGLVNAHSHLELAWTAGRVPGGDGLAAWVATAMSLARPDAYESAAATATAALHMAETGTVAVCDVSNGGDTGAAIMDAGLSGIVQHELLGFHASALPGRVELAGRPIRRLDGAAGPVWVRPSPHAVYSTPPALLVAAARPGPVPATIHLGEDPAERLFTMSGSGPFAEVQDRLGRDWRWWEPTGLGPVDHLDLLGLIGPDLLLVHGVHLQRAEIRLIQKAGAPVCLCPRSNLHIGGKLPDVAALVDAGVRLALGTDSLGSAPDLNLLEEVRTLCVHVPDVSPIRWLVAATSGGADALRLPHVGRLRAGSAPGLLFLEGVVTPVDLARPVPIQRVSRAGP